MKTKLSFIISAVLGIIFGVLSNHSILLGSWLNLIVWGIVGLLIGVFIYDRKYIKWSGLIYGFFLTISFLISGFNGSSSHIFGFIILCIILSVLGALCGWLAVFLGNWLKSLFKNS